jgi:hypothetical protein
MTSAFHQEATEAVVRGTFCSTIAWTWRWSCLLTLTVYLTREVEIEISCIPDIGQTGNADKRALKAYIADAIATNRVRTSGVFGFASHDPDGSVSKVQVYGGFRL